MSKEFFTGVVVGTVATIGVLYATSLIYSPHYMIASNGYNSFVYGTYVNRAQCESKMEELLSPGPIPYLLECSTNNPKPIPN